MVKTNNVKQLNTETHKITDDEKTDQTKFNKFCERFHINPNLISLKLCLFLLYGATSSLLPYLTIHMQSIGLTVEEIATVYLALPFTTFLAPPLTGFMLDKFGRYKPIVIVSMLLNAIIHHSLLFIPHQELPGIMPAAYVIRHNISGYVEVWWSPCPSRECPEEDELDMVIDRCVDHCLLQHPIDPGIQIISKPPLSVPTNPVKTGDVRAVPDVGEIDDLVFHLGNTKRKPMKSSSAFFEIDLHPDLAEPPEQLGIEMQKDENDTVTEFTDRFDEAFLFRSGINITELNEEDLRCGGELKAINSLYMDRLKELTADCLLQKCNFREGGPEICPPDYKESDDATFYIYFLLRFLATVVQLTTVTIVDPIALTMIQKYGGDFGRERLFSSLGMAIFSPITGILIDLSSKSAGYTDYSAAFYTYDILLALSAFTVLAMPLGEKLPNDNLFRDLIKIMTLPHVVLFIFFLFVLGNFWGFIESFLFLYLKELGAPNYMLGITVTVGTVSSMPFLYGAEKITKKIGHVNIFIIAFFSHAVRLVGYSFIESAWWCFPFEAMESLSVHLMWVAAATYCAILAPKNLLATLIGILGMAHFSIGRGSGSFVGGFLIGTFGTRESFRYMGLLAVAGGILYGILHVLWLKKYEQDDKDDDTAGEDTADVEELEKLNTENEIQDNPSQRSIERLSLIIEYNQIGSLTSLARGSKSDIRERVYVLRTRSSSTRRSSYNLIEIIRTPRGSASKVDMLKSALEIHNSKHSLRTHTVLSRNHSASIRLSSKDNLNIRTLSAPKLIQKNSLSHLNSIDLERSGRRSSIPEETEENLDDKQKYQKERSASNENVNTKDKHGQK